MKISLTPFALNSSYFSMYPGACEWHVGVKAPGTPTYFMHRREKFMKKLGKIVGERLRIITTITCIKAIHETKGRKGSGGARERTRAG